MAGPLSLLDDLEQEVGYARGNGLSRGWSAAVRHRGDNHTQFQPARTIFSGFRKTTLAARQLQTCSESSVASPESAGHIPAVVCC